MCEWVIELGTAHKGESLPCSRLCPYLLSGGMIRRSEKYCKEGVCSIQCFPWTTRFCACFRDYAHPSRIQGVLIFGGYVLSGH